MTILHIFFVLRARWPLILITLLSVVLMTLAIGLVMPKTYKSTTALLLNYKGVDPVSGAVLAAQLANGYMATQIDIITSKGLALKVVDNIGATANPRLKQQFAGSGANEAIMRDWLADRLLHAIEVLPARESSVLEITAHDPDPVMAATIANGFAIAYQQMNLQLKVGPLQKAAGYFSDQSKLLRAHLEDAESKLAKYQQEHGLVSTDNRVDIETARLNELSSQMVVAQEQRIEAESREHLAKSHGGDASPDIVANPLIQGLKASLSQEEAKFSQLSQNLGVNHPLYLATKAEVERLRADLNRHIAETNDSIVNNADILRRREAEIHAALDVQKSKILDLNREREEMSILSKEVENAQRAYDNATQRFTQTNMEGQSNQSDVSILTAAVPSRFASSPNQLFNAGLSATLGMMLGVALAVLAELIAGRVRSAEDLIRTLRAPVLGEIAWN